MLRSSFFWASATLMLLRRRRGFVMQTARTDCGIASALTVLNMMGRSADPVQAAEYLDPDCAGSSLDALRRYFEEQQGIGAVALSVPAASLHKINGRAILHMQQQQGCAGLRPGDGAGLLPDGRFCGALLRQAA